MPVQAESQPALPAGCAFRLGLLLLMLSGPAAAGQALLQLPIGDPARRDRQVELHLDAITDTATGEIIQPAQLAERLTGAGLLFIGETHTRMEFHRVQMRTIEALHRAGREVLIGLEMFPYTAQPVLDAWIAGHYTEEGFLAAGDWYRHWGYHWGYYREIFLYAREHGLRMYAVNTPREVVSAVRRKGFRDLTPEEARHIPQEVLPVTDELRQMYRAFFAEDDTLHVAEESLDGMLRAQSTWDATMGWNALQALREHGGAEAIMVVLIGAGHVTYGLGSERQIRPHFPGRIASLIPVELEDGDGHPVERVQASYANFVWGIPRAAHMEYPSLEVSLMGPIGARPNEIIQVGRRSVGGRAGLRVGDILLSLDGQPVDSGAALRKLESGYRWGDMITARIERDGAELELSIPVRRAGP